MEQGPTMDSIKSMSSDQKLDFLISAVMALQKTVANVEPLLAKVADLEAKNRALEESNKNLKSSLTSLSSDVRHLKDQMNVREQQLKNNAIRLFNFPGSNDETNLVSKVYDRILKPILAAAKAKGDLPSLPQANTCIEEVFRAGRFAAGKDKPPPAIIIKFSSPSARMAVLRNKRTSMPSPNEAEKASGSRCFLITEDLTTPTYRKLQELRQDDRVAKAWTQSGVIWFVPSGENQKARPVKSVFEPLDRFVPS